MEEVRQSSIDFVAEIIMTLRMLKTKAENNEKQLLMKTCQAHNEAL